MDGVYIIRDIIKLHFPDSDIRISEYYESMTVLYVKFPKYYKDSKKKHTLQIVSVKCYHESKTFEVARFYTMLQQFYYNPNIAAFAIIKTIHYLEQMPLRFKYHMSEFVYKGNSSIPHGPGCGDCIHREILKPQTIPGGVPSIRCHFLQVDDHPLLDDNIKICGENEDYDD